MHDEGTLQQVIAHERNVAIDARICVGKDDLLDLLFEATPTSYIVLRPRVGIILLQQTLNLLPLLPWIHARQLAPLLCEDLDERLTVRWPEITDAVEQQQESLALEASDYVAQRIAYRYPVVLRRVVVQDVLSLLLDDVLLEERPQVIGSVTTVKAQQQEDSRE